MSQTVAKEGVSLTQAACLAKCNGAKVDHHSSGTFELDAFRRQVQGWLGCRQLLQTPAGDCAGA